MLLQPLRQVLACMHTLLCVRTAPSAPCYSDSNGFDCCCRRAKYTLEHLVRVNLAGQDKAYRCVYQLEDENGESYDTKHSLLLAKHARTDCPHAMLRFVCCGSAQKIFLRNACWSS
jgi:hypothetical protein